MMNDKWDGRQEFYPSFGYELDARHHGQYVEYCKKEGLSHLFQSRSDECLKKDDEDEESSEDEGDIKGLPREVIYTPPLYDRIDHYHELYEEDQKYRCFVTSKSGRNLLDELLFNQNMLKKKKWNTIMEEDSTKLILENRKNNPSIKAARKGMVTLIATIKGLKEGAPTRKVDVPGKIPLSVLHDRVLCPIFGWTRGFHDYRFVVPPSGYNEIHQGSQCSTSLSVLRARTR